MLRVMGDVGILATAFSLCVGIGISAACGFRIFLPPLAMAIAHRAGVPLVSQLPEWLGTWPAIMALGTAALVEIGAYYIPLVDNALDTIASPAAVLAGILLTAGLLEGVDPGWKWALAIVAGGGAAGATQAVTVATRGLSTAATAGLTNSAVSTGESVGSVVMITLTLVLAPLAVLLFVLVFVWLVRFVMRRRKQGAAEEPNGKATTVA